MVKLATFVESIASRGSSHLPSLMKEGAHVAAKALMLERAQPQMRIRPEVSSAILTPFFHKTWQTVETLPYVKPFVTRVREERLDTDGILTKDGSVNPERVDHYANRQLRKRDVFPVDEHHEFPQFHPLAGDVQSRLMLSLVGMQPVGERINFTTRAVKGGGFISKSYPSVILPRWFTSEQDLDNEHVPSEVSAKIARSIRGAEAPLYTKEDWELLLAADAGEALSESDCTRIGTVILPKMLARNYTPSKEVLEILRQAEAEHKLWAEYTRNCYERGADLNHGTIPVLDIPRASAVMRSLGIPTVPDQGVGTKLEQGAAGSADYAFFLEYIHRIQQKEVSGGLRTYPNGEPVWEENAFNFNANGIFAATSQDGQKSQVERLQEQASKGSATGRGGGM